MSLDEDTLNQTCTTRTIIFDQSNVPSTINWEKHPPCFRGKVVNVGSPCAQLPLWSSWLRRLTVNQGSAVSRARPPFRSALFYYFLLGSWWKLCYHIRCFMHGELAEERFQQFCTWHVCSNVLCKFVFPLPHWLWYIVWRIESKATIKTKFTTTTTCRHKVENCKRSQMH